MLKFVIFASVLCLYYVSYVEAISGSTIANKADSHVGQTKWSKAPSNTDTSHFFISDVMKEVGGNVPYRGWSYFPIRAYEWGHPNRYFSTCWSNVESPSIGDVMSDGVHVAFYTGHRTTTSAAEFEVVKNNWGFRSGSGLGAESNNYAYWRYVC